MLYASLTDPRRREARRLVVTEVSWSLGHAFFEKIQKNSDKSGGKEADDSKNTGTSPVFSESNYAIHPLVHEIQE